MKVTKVRALQPEKYEVGELLGTGFNFRGDPAVIVALEDGTMVQWALRDVKAGDQKAAYAEKEKVEREKKAKELAQETQRKADEAKAKASAEKAASAVQNGQEKRQ